MRVYHSPEVEIELTAADTSDVLTRLGFAGDSDLDESKNLTTRDLLIAIGWLLDNVQVRVVPTRL